MDNNVRSTFKFFGEQLPKQHGGQLLWPGIRGLPFRCTNSSTPILDKTTYDKLYYVGDAWHAVFDLSKEEDSKMYCWVRDRIRNGWFTLDYIERHWDPEKKTMIVYMEWTQYYVQLHNPEREQM